MLERLVLKNDADCTSQRLKRTSGARVMTFSCLALIGNCHACTIGIVDACTIAIVHACDKSSANLINCQPNELPS